MGGCASRSTTLSNVEDFDFDDDDPPIPAPEKTPVNVEETMNRDEAEVQKV